MSCDNEAAEPERYNGVNEALASVSVLSEPVYRQAKTPSVLHLWVRIGQHQWRRSRYRILVRDPPSHLFLLIGRALIGIGRLAIFATGSIVMGNILFMPVPDDFNLFLLVLFTTAISCQLWSGFWANGNRGADLVVFVKEIKMVGGEHGDM